MIILAKDSFVFYKSFYEAIKKLNKRDQLILYSHICEYCFGEKLDNLEGVPGAIFDLIKPQIDANFRRYENGLKGGRPKTKTKPNNNLNETKTEGNVNVNVNDNVNDNVNVNVNVPSGGNKTNTNKKPTKNDILNYCQERGYEIDADRFLEYNEAKGWLMDWPAAVEKWVGVERYKAKQAKKNRFNDFSNQRQNNYSELQIELLRKQNKNLIEGKEAE